MFSSFLSNLNPQALAAKALAAILALGLAAGGGAYVMHRMDASALASLELGYAQAQAEAVSAGVLAQARQDAAAEGAAIAEAQAQEKIVIHTVTVKQEVVQHVPVIHACVPYGFVRVLNDAALGRHDATDPAPVGQPDDACAPVSWDQVASDIADDYGAGRANAEQLNALEATVRSLHDAAEISPKP